MKNMGQKLGPKIAIVKGLTKFFSELEHNNIIYSYYLKLQMYFNGNQQKKTKWVGSYRGQIWSDTERSRKKWHYQ